MAEKIMHDHERFFHRSITRRPISGQAVIFFFVAEFLEISSGSRSTRLVDIGDFLKHR